MFSAPRINFALVLLLALNCGSALNLNYVDYEDFEDLIDRGILLHIAKYINSTEGYDAETCGEDIKLWLSTLSNLPTEEWALKMIDSQGKIPTGILTGNINSLGNYDECLSINFTNSGRNVKGKYCLMKFPLENIISRNRLEYQNTRIANFDANGTLSFNFAICIPSSCKANHIEDILKIISIYAKISISENECSTETSTKFDPEDWAAVGIYSLFILLLISSTIYDLIIRKTSKGSNRYHNILISFSVFSNTSNLLKINSKQSTVKCVNGIRSLSMFWIIIGHRYSTGVKFPMLNSLDVLQWNDTFEAMMIISGHLAVDTFFVLSGLLLSYIFFKQRDKRRCFNMPLFYLHRFLRLTPALAAMVLLHATLYKYLGNGPLWYTMDEFAIKACQKYWWSALLYVQNYVNPLRMCVAQTWYLCVDTQLYILSPILLYPLMKSSRLGMINVLFWILTSQIVVVILVFINKWTAAATTSEISYLTDYYYATHMRATPWLLGFGAGYAIYYSTKVDIEFNKIFVVALWIASLIMIGTVVFGMKPLQEISHVYTDIEDSSYNALARTAWSLAIIWIIIACKCGYGGPINWFLSLDIWEVIGRLTYCMYIIHPWIQFTLLASIRTVQEFSHTQFVFNFLGDLLFTIMLSYIWMMLFESPFLVLEKSLLYQKRVKIGGSTEA